MGIQNNVHVIDNSRIDFTRGLRKDLIFIFQSFWAALSGKTIATSPLLTLAQKIFSRFFMIERGRYRSHAQFE